MKKSLILLSIAALAISCSKVEPNDPATTPAAGQEFSLIAATSSTKTANDGLNTNWVTNDALNVFHAITGVTDNYGTNDKFTVSDLVSSTFTGSLTEALEADKSYDWYVMYPYINKITTPKNPTAGFATVGGKTQTQNGVGSTTHLASTSYPLYGKATNVAASAKPSIQLKQVASVIKVHVTNNSGDAVSVANVKFTGTEDIVGTYYVDFSGTSPILTASGASYVSDIATLNVSGDNTITNNGTGDFYIGIKPFTAPSGSSLKVSVNGYEKTINLSSDTEFKAGKIKQIGFNYDKATPKIENGNYAIIAKDGDKYYAISSDSNSSRRARVEVDYSGSGTFSTSDAKLIWTFTQVTGGYTINQSDSYFKYVKNGISLDSSSNATIVSGSDNSSLWNLTYNDATDGLRYIAMNGTSGFGFYASTTGVHDLYIVSAIQIAQPTWTWTFPTEELEYNDTEQKSISFTTDATTVTATAYTSDTYSEICDWLTINIDLSSSPKAFKYQASVNNTGSNRTAYIRLIAQKDGCTDREVKATVTQKKLSTVTWTKITAAPTDWSGDYLLVYEKNSTSAYVWTGVDAASCYQTATISSGTISGDFIYIHIGDKVDNTYSVKVVGGSNNGKYIGGVPNSNKLNFYTAYSDHLNTITYDTSNNYVVMTAGRDMQFNNSSSDLRFRYYTSGAQKGIQLYKKN